MKTIELKQCQICERYFKIKNNNYKTCGSEECMLSLRRKRCRKSVKKYRNSIREKNKKRGKLFLQCGICRKWFERKKVYQCFCSVECRKIHYRNRNKIWIKNNPERYNNARKKYFDFIKEYNIKKGYK